MTAETMAHVETKNATDTSEPPEEPQDSAVCQERGFYSLLFLAQAIPPARHFR